MISYEERSRIKQAGQRLALVEAISIRIGKARSEFDGMIQSRMVNLQERLDIAMDLIDEIKDLKRDLDALPKPKEEDNETAITKAA
jgi:hypothetical protein